MKLSAGLLILFSVSNGPSRGPLAQLVEQWTFNPSVAGSSPARPTKKSVNNTPELKYPGWYHPPEIGPAGTFPQTFCDQNWYETPTTEYVEMLRAACPRDSLDDMTDNAKEAASVTSPTRLLYAPLTLPEYGVEVLS